MSSRQPSVTGKRISVQSVVFVAGALLAVWSVALVTGASVQGPLWVPVSVGIFLLFKRVTGKRSDAATVLAAIYALLTVASRYDEITDPYESMIFKMGLCFIALAGMFVLYHAICTLLIEAVSKPAVIDACSEKAISAFDNEDGCGAKAAPASLRGFFMRHIPALAAPVCILFYLPYYLYEYPGIVSPDGINQLEQILGIEPLSNHHPVAHTLTVGFFWKLGSLFSDVPNTRLAVVIAAQMVFLAVCAAVSIRTIKAMGFRPAVQLAALAFYAFIPYNATSSIMLLKDIPFSGITVLFISSLAGIIFDKPHAVQPYDSPDSEKSSDLLSIAAGNDVSSEDSRADLLSAESGNDASSDASSAKNTSLPLARIFAFILSGVAFCIYRSNGWFAFIVMMPFLLLLNLRRRRVLVTLLASCAAIIALAAVWRGPVLNAMGAEQPDFAESLHVPLQQIARVLVNDEEISAEDRAMIEAVIDTAWIKEIYDPVFADNVKELVRAGHPEVLEENKREYFMLWLRLGLSHPASYIRAYIDLTEGMWFPDAGVYGIVDIDGICPNSLGLEFSPVIAGPAVVKAKELFLKLGPMLPLYGYLWSMGFFFWLLIFVVVLILASQRSAVSESSAASDSGLVSERGAASDSGLVSERGAASDGGLVSERSAASDGGSVSERSGRNERLSLLLPLAALYLTLFLATPCGRIFRYVYPMVFSAPLWVLLPLKKE